MEIRLSPKKLGFLAGALIALLFVAHAAVQTARFIAGDHSLFGLVTMFSLGAERNLPTYYASVAILFCAILLAVVASAERHGRRFWDPYWSGLAAVFLFLSVDEILEIHERVTERFRSAFDASGPLYYAWVIPYGAATLLFVVLYSRFLLQLPVRTRSLFVAAGAVFVCGALGMEMIGGSHSERFGNENILYVLYQTVEEMLEMIGIAIFLYAVADYIERRCGGLRLYLGD